MTSHFLFLFSCNILATSFIRNGYGDNGTEVEIIELIADLGCYTAKVLYFQAYLQLILISSIPICIHSYPFLHSDVAIWEDMLSSYQSDSPQARHIIPLVSVCR